MPQTLQHTTETATEVHFALAMYAQSNALYATLAYISNESSSSRQQADDTHTHEHAWPTSMISRLQIKHSYGAKPNEDFLQYSGFVDVDNIHDYYTADVLDWVVQHHLAPQKALAAAQADASTRRALQQVLLAGQSAVLSMPPLAAQALAHMTPWHTSYLVATLKLGAVMLASLQFVLSYKSCP